MTMHWSLKLTMFAASVVALSWFFAGWRQVNQSGGLGDWGVLIGGTALTIFFVTVQAYVIYVEEKKKGNLRKRIDLFEKIEKALNDRKNNSIEKKVDSDLHGDKSEGRE